MQTTTTARWPGLLLFKLNWWVLVLGREAWLPAGALLLLLQAGWLLHTNTHDRWRTLLHCLLLAAAGALLDQLLGAAGLFRFPASGVPAWLLLLWLAFAVALQQSAPLLTPRPYWQGCVALMLAGTAGYGAGHWLGAVEFGLPWPAALAVVAACWLLLWPLYRLLGKFTAMMTRTAMLLPTLALLLLPLLLPKSASADTAPLVTLGRAHFSLLFMPIYEARLDAASHSFRFPDTAPYALTLTYQRDIPANRIVDATLDQWRQQGVEWTPQWHALLSRTIPPVQRGDRLQLTVHADGSASLLHNDHVVADYDDTAFVTAFAGIWLDPRTTHPAQRRQLLGESR